MKNLFEPLVTLSFASILVTSCWEDKDPTPTDDVTVTEDLVTILGFWSFTESNLEIVAIPEDSQITINAPNVNKLTWYFDADSILVESPDTAWTESYKYDSMLMELQFSNGTYDVLKLTKDSLSLRYFSEIIDLNIEFYIYFQLTK